LKYLWNFKEISLVLSGMSNMEQVVENVETASDSKPDSLSAEENKAIEEVKKIFNERMIVNCTNCKYCMPCPAGVNIPEVFWAYNHASIFNDHEKAKFWLNNWLTEKQKASNCVKCGQCESKCPQNIEIMKHLEIAKEKYELSDE
jgi:predicted aldo/keto reductase-like oxidoreductase